MTMKIAAKGLIKSEKKPKELRIRTLIYNIFEQERIHGENWEKGAKERNNYLKSKATNNSLIRQPVEPKPYCYERDRRLSPQYRHKKDAID